MKKRLISLLLLMSLLLSLTLTALGMPSLSNFDAKRIYRGNFFDVSSDAWYYDSVRAVYEYRMMDGKSETVFDPSGNLTIAETIKLAATLHKSYYTGDAYFETSAIGTPWHAPYVEYALENDIIAEAYRNYDASATRSDFAMIIAAALPDEAITPINRIVDGAIPDVQEYYSYGWAVYKLYRAGVLTGSDGEGMFYPSETLRRSEAAAIVMRLIKADTRQRLYLANPLTAEQIYKLASPAVFYIEVFDSEGESVKTGSGFFISEAGLAVTNYHVVIGASAAKITMENGEVHDVEGIYDYDWKNDIALIKIDVDDAPYLELADSSEILTGATVYALGSPLGLMGSFSGGIVSQALREVEGTEYIQLDAAISSGSSGGALLDGTGRVVGITSATAVGAQNINLAMPINLLTELGRENHVPLKSIIIETAFYEGFFPAPDFGAYFGVEIYSADTSWGNTSYSYLLSDLDGDVGETIDAYTHLLEQNLFTHINTLANGETDYKVYYNSQHDIMLSMGIDEVDEMDCFKITVSS